MYGVISSLTKKIKKVYGSIGSTTKEIKKIYGVVGGITKLIYNSGIEIVYPLYLYQYSLQSKYYAFDNIDFLGSYGTTFSGEFSTTSGGKENGLYKVYLYLVNYDNDITYGPKVNIHLPKINGSYEYITGAKYLEIDASISNGYSSSFSTLRYYIDGWINDSYIDMNAWSSYSKSNMGLNTRHFNLYLSSDEIILTLAASNLNGSESECIRIDAIYLS